MNREEFINALNEKIQNDPDHNEIVSYYYELINDKIDSGMTEEEAIESLGDLDSIVKNIEESKSEDVKENINDDSKEAKEEKKEKVIDNTSETKEVRQEVSGGRKFAYVLWCIASVIFCIISVVITVLSISISVAGGGCIVVGIIEMIESPIIGAFVIGVGVFLIGISIVAIHFSKVLRKYIFSNRITWNEQVRKKAMGE